MWTARNQLIYRAFSEVETVAKSIQKAKDWQAAHISLWIQAIVPEDQADKPQTPLCPSLFHLVMLHGILTIGTMA